MASDTDDRISSIGDGDSDEWTSTESEVGYEVEGGEISETRRRVGDVDEVSRGVTQGGPGQRRGEEDGNGVKKETSKEFEARFMRCSARNQDLNRESKMSTMSRGLAREAGQTW